MRNDGCNVLPATIDTPLFQHAANFAGRAVRAMPPVHAPEEVAEAIVDLIRHPRREVRVGNAGRMIALRAFMPRALTERMLARKVGREHFQRRPSRPSLGNVFEPLPELNAVHGGWMEDGNGARSAARIGGTLALAAGLGLLAYYLAGRSSPTGPRRVSRVLRAAGV